MKIAIVGGGFTGLTAAYKLAKGGRRVTLFEKEKILGGLARGFKPVRRRGEEPNWDWHLEDDYHHWFTNDHAMLNLIKELGLYNKLIIKRPITANYVSMLAGRRAVSSPSETQDKLFFACPERSRRDGARTTAGRPQRVVTERIFQLDSPIHLLRFPGLSMIDKLRTAALLAFFKLSPFWKPLEGVTAKDFFITWGGSASWRILWEPLMVGKFEDYADTVAASWFWARIKKRTPKLMYMEGGFRTVIDALATSIKKNGGKIYTGVAIDSIKKNHSSFIIHHSSFDNVLLTVPTPIARNLVPFMPGSYFRGPSTIPHLWAQTLILETKEPILKDVYWLNITDRSFPFLAVVSHTNFVDKTYYGGHHITYFGNYLPTGHPYLSMSKKHLLKKFLPFIKKLNPSLNYELSTINSFLFVSPFAQPVHQLHYSQKIPPIKTPVNGIYLANMDFVVPWDRGTNYAVELGVEAARSIDQEN